MPYNDCRNPNQIRTYEEKIEYLWHDREILQARIKNLKNWLICLTMTLILQAVVILCKVLDIF